MCTSIEVVVVPPVVSVVIDVLCDDLLPSHSMSHMPFPGVGIKRDNIYLHSQPSNKKCSISSLDSLPSSACSYILHVGAHRIDICDTMVPFHNLVGLVPQIADNFGSQGKYL